MSNMLRAMKRSHGVTPVSNKKGRMAVQLQGAAKAQYKKNKELNDLHDRGRTKLISVNVFLRSPVRKPREPFHVYRRSMKNYNRAMKVRLKYGPEANLWLNLETLRIIW